MPGEIIKLNDFSNEISNQLANLVIKDKIKIKIVSIIIGDDPSSMSYLNGMKKRGVKLGIEVQIISYPLNVSEVTVLNDINILNNDISCAGIILQMPLPVNLDSRKIINSIDYRKDIDGLGFINQGRLFSGYPFLIPATGWAVDMCLSYLEKNYGYKLAGKIVTIIGRSNTVGKPAFHLLLKRNLTITVVHTKTVSPENITSKSDIVVAACGVPQLIDDKWVKNGSVVIDVGIHCKNDESCKICGDVDSDKVIQKAAYLTAVPGGVGSLTNVLLFANTIKAYYKMVEDTEYSFDFEK